MMLMGRFRCVDHCDIKYLIFGAPRKIRWRQTVYTARRKSPPGTTGTAGQAPVDHVRPDLHWQFGTQESVASSRTQWHLKAG